MQGSIYLRAHLDTCKHVSSIINQTTGQVHDEGKSIQIRSDTCLFTPFLPEWSLEDAMSARFVMQQITCGGR